MALRSSVRGAGNAGAVRVPVVVHNSLAWQVASVVRVALELEDSSMWDNTVRVCPSAGGGEAGGEAVVSQLHVVLGSPQFGTSGELQSETFTPELAFQAVVPPLGSASFVVEVWSNRNTEHVPMCTGPDAVRTTAAVHTVARGHVKRVAARRAHKDASPPPRFLLTSSPAVEQVNGEDDALVIRNACLLLAVDPLTGLLRSAASRSTASHHVSLHQQYIHYGFVLPCGWRSEPVCRRPSALTLSCGGSTKASGAYLFRPLAEEAVKASRKDKVVVSKVEGPVVSFIQVHAGEAYQQVR